MTKNQRALLHDSTLSMSKKTATQHYRLHPVTDKSVTPSPTTHLPSMAQEWLHLLQ